MIREDYILAWIRRYVQWVAEIIGLVKQEDYLAAIRRIDMVLRVLLDAGPDSVVSLTEGEILARLTLGDPPQLTQERCVVLAVVLKQLGIVCAAQNRPDASRDCWLKALHVVLGLRLRPEALPLAEFAPTIEELTEKLGADALPPRTQAALMIFYEQTGQYARAEDALFALIEAVPGAREPLDIGAGFYHRLRALSDEVLAAGGLPRAEVDAGSAEVEARR